MTKLSAIPYAAIGAASQAARTIGDRVENTQRDVRTRADRFITRSAEEGRGVLSRVPGASQVLGAASAAGQPVTDIVGVDARTGAKLRRAGISTVGDMWSHAGDRTGRADLAGITGIPTDRLADYAKKADLMRVKSIGPRHAALLEAAGVTSLKQLRRRTAESLHETLAEVNRSKKVVETLPTVDEIAAWIEGASLIAR
jgi:hypothetical protein